MHRNPQPSRHYNMRHLVLGIVFFMIEFGAHSQSYIRVSGGMNHTSTLGFKNYGFRMKAFNTYSRYLIDASYSEFNRPHFGLNYNFQFVHREVSGTSTQGGLGSGSTVWGYGNVSYVYFGLLPEWIWGNKLKYHSSIGLQMGFRVQSFADLKRSHYGPYQRDHSPISSQDLFNFMACRIPISIGLSYPIGEKIRLGLSIQLAADILRLGYYFASFKPVDQSLLLRVQIPVKSLKIAETVIKNRYSN